MTIAILTNHDGKNLALIASIFRSTLDGFTDLYPVSLMEVGGWEDVPDSARFEALPQGDGFVLFTSTDGPNGKALVPRYLPKTDRWALFATECLASRAPDDAVFDLPGMATKGVSGILSFDGKTKQLSADFEPDGSDDSGPLLFGGTPIEFTVAEWGDGALPTAPEPAPPSGPAPSITLDQIIDVIAAHGPQLHIHPAEDFQPTNIEYFLENASLWQSQPAGEPAKVLGPPVHMADLAAHTTPDYFLQLEGGTIAMAPTSDTPALPDVDVRRGDFHRARAYVHPVWDGQSNHIDLQFWFFYAYNGAGTAFVQVFHAGAISGRSAFDLWPLGEHQGDWEVAILRIDLQTLKPVAMFLSQHDGGVSFTSDAMNDAEKVTRDAQGRIKLYASLNGHATYSRPGPNASSHEKREFPPVTVEFGLLNDCLEGGNILDCSTHFELLPPNWPTAMEAPDWTRFSGRWGKVYSAPLSFPPDALTSSVKTFIDHAFAMESAGLGSIDLDPDTILTMAGPVLPFIVKKYGGSTLADVATPAGPTAPPAKPDWNQKQDPATWPAYTPPAPWKEGTKNDFIQTVNDMLTKLAEGANTVKRTVVNVISTVSKAIVSTVKAIGNFFSNLFG